MVDLLRATPLLAVNAVAVDTETTGLDVEKARLIEIAAIPLDGGALHPDRAHVQLVACGEPIPAAASAVHGILDGDLAGQPSFGEVAETLHRLLTGRVIIGHTIGFDLALLEREFARAGQRFRPPLALDVRVLAQIAAPNLPGYGLEALAAWLDVPVTERHRARGDAEIAGRVFLALVPRLRERGVRTLGEALARCRQASEATGAPAAWTLDDAPPDADDPGPRLDGYPYRHDVADVMSRDPVHVPARMPLAEAIALMAGRRFSSVLVGDDLSDAGALGILTERDALRALAAKGAPALAEPVGDIASRPLLTVPADARLYRAIGRMTARNLRHLAVTGPADEVVGIVTTRDLLRLRATASIALGDDIDTAADAPALAAAWAKLPAVARALVDEEVPARDIAGVIAREVGALTRRAAELAEAGLAAEGHGAAPCPYAVLVLGSAGRGESLLAMDQDNALIFAEGEPDGPEDLWFARLGRRIAALLDEVGVPLCKGGVMASEPAFRGSVATWRGRIATWLSRSRPEDLLAVDIFYDARPVHGARALAAAVLSEAWDAARDGTGFLKLLAEGAAEPGSHLGFFGGLKTEEDGRLDLKRAGLKRLVTAARVLALRHGIREHSTHRRLTGVRALGRGHDADLGLFDGDHALVLDTILRQQLRDIRAGLPPGNRIATAQLDKPRRAALAEAIARQGGLDDILRGELSD